MSPAPIWTRRGVVMLTVVAPVVLIGGGLLAGRLSGWSWASAIFLGVVAYVVVIDVVWLLTGAFAVRRDLRARAALLAEVDEQVRRVG